VDCGSARCIQDRRVFKKELLTWSKKVPLLVGMEQVAEQLLGKKLTHRLLEPFTALENSEAEDFEPEESCSFCDSKTKTSVSLSQISSYSVVCMWSLYYLYNNTE